jgi:MFS transporter, DHA1 family, inner membrane transport protein
MKLDRAMPWALIGAACLGSFAATSAGTTRAPFLLEMSSDLDVPMPLVANLVSLTSIAWGITSALGGWASDRIGRRLLLIGAPLALALSVALQAASINFTVLACWAIVSGAASGTVMGLLFAEVASHVEDRQRGRALGWVMSGQSLTLVIGVPMAAAIGSIIGWRGWLVCVAALAMAASFALFVTVPRAATLPGSGDLRRNSLAGALSPRVLGLLATGVAERTCYGLAAVYYATFLQMSYGLSVAALAVPLAIFAVGNVVGTILGGHLADRLYDRLFTFAIAMALSGIAALALFLWHPNPGVSIALGFLYVLINALGRPSLMASYAAVPEQMRGTVMGLSGAAASLGWCGAAGFGAALLAGLGGADGFDGFGPLALALGLLGASGALWCRRQYAI